jgi:hypothetical protein
VQFAAWINEYCRLSLVMLNLVSNARKFKILQAAKWAGTDLDVAQRDLLELFPSQLHEGVVKRPTVVRGALKINGVGVGYESEARSKIVLEQVVEHENSKLKVLKDFTPALGAQTADLYARFALKPSTVFNHQARGNEPSISRAPLQHAAESQAALLRVITATDPHLIRDVQFDAATSEPHERRCEEAAHLSLSRGGFGYTHPTLVAAGASAGRVVDVLYILRRVPSVSALVPTPDQ